MLRNLVIVVQRPIEAILLLRPAVCCVSRRTRIDRERGRDDLLVAVGLLLAVGSALYAPNGRAEAAAVPSTEETSEQTAPEPKPFQLAEVTDRTAFNEHWEVVEQLIRRNRPWLHPSLDHLGSVEFVHTIQPGSFVERFAWRNDGASLVKVMETDEDGKWSRGKWEVITPEAALYAGSEGAKLSTRRDGKEETDFLRRTGGHLTGTQCMLAVFDVGRHPDTFAIESIERDEDNGRIKLTLRPALGRYGVGIGGTLHFHHQSKSSRAYRRNVGRVEIECDTKTRRPLHETDYDTDGAIVCKADFLDYLEVGEGEAVPQRIKVSMPHVAATVDVDYRFQWRPEGVWILQRATSQVALAEEHQSLTQVVRDVKINEPSRALEEALAEAAATREYVEAEGTQAPSPLKVYAFALGTPVQAGKAQVLFTVSHDRRLMARVDSPQTESPTSVVLVGKNGRILGATSAGADERLDFGKSEALGGAAYFALTLPTPEASREAPSKSEVLAVPLHLDREIVVDIPDQKEGKTRVKRVRLERADGNLKANVELISTDHGHFFGATACIALLGAKGRVLVAASKEIPLRVDLSEIKSEMVTVDLGPVEWEEEGEMVAIGLARSRDWQTFGPSTWATWIPTVQPVPFSTGQLIRGEDVGTWKIALENLEQELHGGLIPHVVLDDSQLSQIWGASRSPKKLLEPYAERMVELLARKRHEDAESLELLCRLIGYARQEDQIEVLKRYLEDERSTVRDAAAIGLGLLVDAAGMARLVEIIRRPDVTLPKNYTAQQRQAWQSARRRATDAAIALATIGTEPAIEAMGKLAIEGIRRELDVRESLVILLRNSRHPAAVPYLAEIVALGDDAKGVWRLAADGLAGNRQAARDSFTKCLENGHYFVIDRLSGTKDDYYVPLVRELFFKSDVPERPLYQAANYLWNTDTKESLEAMRELFDSNPRPDTTEPRLRLAVALAARGDDLGFDHALETLRELARPFDLPKDQTERRSVERGRQRREEMALDVFQRAKGLDASIVECLEKGLRSDDDRAVLAALRVVEKLGKTPDALLPLLKQLATSTNPKIATTAAQLARRL
ncbi:MAG: hypothetical protein GXY83_40845 [Rhodopirellula sp.]|nr:hypothetical protein [Rhodopirellula sp.]